MSLTVVIATITIVLRKNFRKFGLSSGLSSVYVHQIIKVTVRFGFDKKKRLIRVFGLRSGSVRRPDFGIARFCYCLCDFLLFSS